MFGGMVFYHINIIDWILISILLGLLEAGLMRWKFHISGRFVIPVMVLANIVSMLLIYFTYTFYYEQIYNQHIAVQFLADYLKGHHTPLTEAQIPFIYNGLKMDEALF